MTMPNSQSLQDQIDALKEQQRQAILAENAEADRQEKAAKEAETAKEKKYWDDIRAGIEQHKARQVQLEEAEKQYWVVTRQNCYREGRFVSWGLCQTFFDAITNSELQRFPLDDWCRQCVRGWQNPYVLDGMLTRALASPRGS